MSRGDSYEQKFAAEHRQLDAMFEELLAVVRGGSTEPAAMGAAFADLREAFESHIEQEDRLYYPAVRALQPARRAAIQALVDAHAQFRARLDEIDARFATGTAAGVESALAAFVAAFAAHEAAEERLLRAIDDELEQAEMAAPS